MYICITLGLLVAGIVIFFIWRIVDSKVVVYPLEAPSRYSSFGEFAVEWFIGIVFPLMSAACFIGGMVAFRTGSEKARDERYANIRETISSGYTLYINGAETDISHITLEDYSLDTITVNDESKEVHIAANK